MNKYDKFIKIILDYWFKNHYYKINYEKWFKNGEKYDNEIKLNFEEILIQAENKKLLHWYDTKDGFIAHTILLDQFSRHIYRNLPGAYKNDNFALINVNLNIYKYINQLKPVECLFALMPYQHSENIIEQQKGNFILNCLLSNEKRKSGINILKEAVFHQGQHLKTIEKFKRFPKRNKILGRKSTSEEIKYINSTSNLPY